jgi:hypothetical protein
LTRALTTFGKTLLIVAGVGVGFVRGLRAFDTAADVSVVKARVDSLSLAVAQLGDQSEQLGTRLQAAATRIELSQTLDRVLGKLESEIDERFERQTRSVEALQLMLAQTDELLQKVLDGLGAVENERDLSAANR